MQSWQKCSKLGGVGLPRPSCFRDFMYLFVVLSLALVPAGAKYAPIQPAADVSAAETVRAWADDLPQYISSTGTSSSLRGRALSMTVFNNTVSSSPQTLRPAAEEDNFLRPPRVVLLFLTRSGWENEELWQAFFKKVPSSQYQIFMHCTNPSACDTWLKARPDFGIKRVSTVPTTYCSNLMSAMVQLLQESVGDNSHPRDKFVFLSESTLPVKPFAYIHKELTQDSKSDFCVQKPEEWTKGVNCEVVKHSQWVVLNTDHAQLAISNWPQIASRFKDHRYTLPLMDPTTGQINGERTVPEARLCTDEWGFLASIWGAIPSGASVSDDTINPSTLDRHAKGAQGVCRTFAFWSAAKSDKQAMNMVLNLRHAFPQSRLDCSDEESMSWEVPDCGGLTHPVTIAKADYQGARIMRQSDFLFVRKFKPGVMSLYSFRSEILGVYNTGAVK